MNKTNSSFEIFEWFYETINKRLGQGIKLEELFACVPCQDEAEFEYELLKPFNLAKRKLGISQGNALMLDYPHIATLAKSSNKVLKIRIFFIHPSRLDRNLILQKGKFKYPKVEQRNKTARPFDFSSTDVNVAIKEHRQKERLLTSIN